MSSENNSKRIEIESSVQLLVEGKDDRNFFRRFIEHLSLSDIQIQSFDGTDNLRSFLQEFVKQSKFGTVKSIGIVRDADSNMESAWQSVHDGLENAKLPIPNCAGQKSNDEPTDGKPTISVFILPDNKNKGMLESLLCKSFETEDVNKCIDNFFQCLEKLPSPIIINRIDKARAHAYIATQTDPHVSAGVASWNFDHPTFTDLKAFLKDLTPNK